MAKTAMAFVQLKQSRLEKHKTEIQPQKHKQHFRNSNQQYRQAQATTN